MDIKPYKNNGKKHPKAQIDALARIVKEVGWRQPALVNQEGVLVVGHGRYETWIQNKDILKPIWIIDDTGKTVHGGPETTPLTPNQEKAYRLADNKLNESDWDMKLVLEDLKELHLDHYDITLTGFGTDLILEPDAKDDEIPENAPTVAKKGDIWALGRHRLICGDSTSLEDVGSLMGSLKADMVFTDPPYNVDYKGMQNSKQWDKIANDAMAPTEFREFLEKVFKNYYLFTKDGGATYICHADKSHIEFRQAFEKVGYGWRATIIWEKNSPAFNFAQYKYKHEPIFYCFKEGKKVSWYGDRTQNTIWKASKEKGDHPTIKPVELILNALRNSSKEEDIVLDLFLGSGSTLIACEKTNRICMGCEIAPKYVDVIIKRWEDYTGKKAKKVI